MKVKNNEPIKLTDVLMNLKEKAGNGSLNVEDFVASLESRGFGPLILAPSILALLPTGAIPGVPSICGVVIFFVVVQILLGKKHPWLPKAIGSKEISGEKIENMVNSSIKWTKKLDRLIHPRFSIMIRKPSQYVIATVSIFLSISMIPLELVPFAVAVPAFALCLISLGLCAKDGLLVLIGYLSIFAGGSIIYYLIY